jgi:uncharacterized LabA/DUF88 family protein
MEKGRVLDDRLR